MCAMMMLSARSHAALGSPKSPAIELLTRLRFMCRHPSDLCSNTSTKNGHAPYVPGWLAPYDAASPNAMARRREQRIATYIFRGWQYLLGVLSRVRRAPLSFGGVAIGIGGITFRCASAAD